MAAPSGAVAALGDILEQAFGLLRGGGGGAPDFLCAGPLTTTPPGLEVTGVGAVELPLSAAAAAALKRVAAPCPFGRGEETVVDPAVRRCLQVEPSQFSLDPGALTRRRSAAPPARASRGTAGMAWEATRCHDSLPACMPTADSVADPASPPVSAALAWQSGRQWWSRRRCSAPRRASASAQMQASLHCPLPAAYCSLCAGLGHGMQRWALGMHALLASPSTTRVLHEPATAHRSRPHHRHPTCPQPWRRACTSCCSTSPAPFSRQGGAGTLVYIPCRAGRGPRHHGKPAGTHTPLAPSRPRSRTATARRRPACLAA